MKENKITTGIAIVVLVAVALLITLEIFNRNALNSVNAMYDTTVIDYEAYKTTLSELQTVYSIWDEYSYIEAEKTVKLSSGLKDKIFTGYQSTGMTSAPAVDFIDITYELEPVYNGMRTYFCQLRITDRTKNKTEYKNIIATVQGDYIIDFTEV